MNQLQQSWDSFTPDLASKYLITHGAPSQTSKAMLADVLLQYSAGRKISILDLGCGNAHLYDYFKERKLSCSYTGVDFSDALLSAATQLRQQDADFKVIQDDVSKLTQVITRFDVAIYSHVIEMMSCPERSLLRARELADRIIIRFFEPPDFDVDEVELLEMEVGDGRKVPYLRRMMSRDYYRLILTKMKVQKVLIHRDNCSKDQLHVLEY